MVDINNLVRKNIRNLIPYSSARDEYEGSKGIFLDANESPFGKLNRYPDPYQKELKAAISRLKGIEKEKIFLGNGSDEIIDLCYRTFCYPGTDKALIFSPTYGMYAVSAAVNDVKVINIPLTPDFQINPECLKQYLDDDNLKLVFICSPNNPTGNSMNQADIKKIIEDFRGIVVLDEAYIDFSDKQSFIRLIDSYPNLIVMQTFSKAMGLAAARIGMAFMNPEIVRYFNRLKPPYNISTINQKAALKRTFRIDDYRNNVNIIKEERERLSVELKKLYITDHVFPSDANFLLVKVKNADLIYKLLVDKSIIVRNRSNVIENCLRITVGTRYENKRLINALKKIDEDIDRNSCIVIGDRLSEIDLAENVGGKSVSANNQNNSSAVSYSTDQNEIYRYIKGKPRFARVERNTSETKITVEIDLDGSGKESITTGIGFFDHLLRQIARHGNFDLMIDAKGDLESDEHHLIEDVAIVLGETLLKASGSKIGIERYGFLLPMDDSLAQVALDFGGRPWLEWNASFVREKIGEMPTEMFYHFFKSFSDSAKCNLNIKIEGTNEHHKIEAIFKAFARALKMALKQSDIFILPTTKGVL
jgi:histidinol-phosphate aminotransferase